MYFLKSRFPSIIVACLLLSVFSRQSLAQISPPGLGRAHAASWASIGVQQDLSRDWQSMSYVGLGFKSNPDDQNPIAKRAIWVFNQEFTRRWKEGWKYSAALSYRSQDEYASAAPYEHELLQTKKELRLYGRMSYTIDAKYFKLIPTLRQEVRTFYSPDFRFETDFLQLRTRLRLQAVLPLGKSGVHTARVSAEQLFSSTMNSVSNQWSGFGYRESRFLLYYSYSPKSEPFILSLGYMNNLVRDVKPFDAHYLAVDLVFKNPLSRRR